MQGIQQFILQSPTLGNNIEASDLVKYICEGLFEECLPKGCTLEKSDRGCPVTNAAGKVRYIFSNREDCEAVVLDFPRRVLNMAPGITISQAVVEVKSDNQFQEKMKELEELLIVQRNKPMPSLTIGLMGIKRDAQTNLPIQHNEQVYKDRSEINNLLCRDAFGKDIKSLYNIEDMTQSNDWIAVVHADGNGLGQVVKKVAAQGQEAYSSFSRKLDKCCKLSARAAFEAVKEAEWENDKGAPIRPVVLGGDDFTFICRASLAIPLVTAFIREFESQTEKEIGKLTVCAGIAYVKSSFPYYYSYELAESLCEVAKEDTKRDCPKDKPAPSCLMFHKVQDSFITDYKEIVARELTPSKSISLKYGPYYLDPHEDRWTIDKIEMAAKELTKEDEKENNKGLKSRLRKYLTILHDQPQLAVQELNRIKQIYSKDKDYIERVTNPRPSDKAIPVYDILSLHTINNQITKS